MEESFLKEESRYIALLCKFCASKYERKLHCGFKNFIEQLELLYVATEMNLTIV